MNNLDCTQKVVFEKLLQYSKNSDTTINDMTAEKDFLSVMYRFLNATIDNRYQTSARVVTTSKKGLMGKFVIFCKKVYRKISFWYVEPVCKSQTQFNEMCTQFCINTFYLLEKMQKDKNNETLVNEKLKEELQTLKSKMDEIIAENVVLNGKIQQFETNQGQFFENIEKLRMEVPLLFDAKENDFWNKQTVAQSGEDAIIAYILMVLGINYKDEYYLDLGANHARELSNTYMLYKNGMRGVLVEANPDLIDELKFYRGEDIVINKCIANETNKKIKFYVMSGNGLSSSDLEAVNEAMAKNPSLTITDIIDVESITVNDILEQYFDRAPLILNIDIEGLEEEILRTIDYEKYAPKLVIVERIEYDTTIATKKRADDIQKIMEEKGYFEYAFTGINSIFINQKWLKEFSR